MTPTGTPVLSHDMNILHLTMMDVISEEFDLNFLPPSLLTVLDEEEVQSPSTTAYSKKMTTETVIRYSIKDDISDEERALNGESSATTEMLHLSTKYSFKNADVITSDLLAELIDSNDLDSCFCVVNLQKIAKNVSSWQSFLPRVEPSYIIGANNDSQVLEALTSKGLSFTVGSVSDYKSLNSFGKAPLNKTTDTCFARDLKYIQTAIKSGITEFVVDDVADMVTIAAEATEPTSFVIGLAMFDSDVYGVKVSEVSKFIEHAKALGVKVSGVSIPLCHVSESQMTRGAFEAPFIEAVSAVNTVYKACISILGTETVEADFTHVMFSGNTLDKIVSKGCDFTSSIVGNVLEKYFPSASFSKLVFSANASNALVSGSCTIATTIVGIRRGRDECMYYVDDGIYGSFHSYMVGDKINAELRPQPLVIGHDYVRQTALSTVWGPTCDSLDKLASHVMLPMLNVDDWLYFSDVGAFGINCGTTFNGIEPPTMVYIHS